MVACLLLDRAISGRRLTPLTALLKAAILSRHQMMHGEPPAVLHGHGINDNGYDLARFLALPDVGYPRSRGRNPWYGIVASARLRRGSASTGS